ncbi:MLP-like protein 28 [Olea europaea var. sylvestris]|uniref:MLP-like protein 28 n=1 Tax=Olea europaea var. sylvestris TaxID=158386 RepID=UPI000C1D389C|nr:MLP-like protein 28 [Olea europaea var. sylvestris]
MGKLVSQIAIKSDGDVFHEIFRERPHHISGMSPANIQKCDLHDGQWGTVGSVIYWNYTHVPFSRGFETRVAGRKENGSISVTEASWLVLEVLLTPVGAVLKIRQKFLVLDCLRIIASKLKCAKAIDESWPETLSEARKTEPDELA